MERETSKSEGASYEDVSCVGAWVFVSCRGRDERRMRLATDLNDICVHVYVQILKYT